MWIATNVAHYSSPKECRRRLRCLLRPLAPQQQQQTPLNQLQSLIQPLLVHRLMPPPTSISRGEATVSQHVGSRTLFGQDHAFDTRLISCSQCSVDYGSQAHAEMIMRALSVDKEVGAVGLRV